jgi:hypothetical protein
MTTVNRHLQANRKSSAIQHQGKTTAVHYTVIAHLQVTRVKNCQRLCNHANFSQPEKKILHEGKFLSTSKVLIKASESKHIIADGCELKGISRK